MKSRNKRVLILLGLVLILIIFNFASNKTPLIARNIIIGIAIDKEKDNYKVSAQTVMTSGSTDSNSGNSSFYIAEGKGLTLMDCFAEITKNTGRINSFKFCNTLLLGNTLSPKDINYILESFYTNNLLIDYILVAMSKENAGEDLKNNITNNSALSFQLRNLFEQDNLCIGVNAITIREYVINLSKENGVSYIPVIKKIEADEGEQSGGKSDSGGKEDKFYLYEVSNTIFIQGEKSLEFNLDESIGMSYATSKIKSGSLVFNKENKRITYEIINVKSKIKYDYDNLKVDFDVDYKLRLHDITENGQTIANFGSLNEEDKKDVENEVISKIMLAFNKGKSEGIDIFNIYDAFYKKGGNKWKDKNNENYLNEVELEVKVNVIFK